MSAEQPSETESVAYFRRELFRTLGNLAKPAAEQIAYLQEIFRSMRMEQEDDWISADELGLEFGDAFSGACGDPVEERSAGDASSA